jgi:hypothetical protein
MYLNPRLAKLLEAYEPERLKAILMWFNADAQSLPAQSERSVDTCYQLASQLELDEMVRISILNEFGPNFEGKAAYQWLNRNMSRRLAQVYQGHN